MNVLLIYPFSKYSSFSGTKWTPLGLSYIAAKLREEGHIISIFDRVSQQQGMGYNKEAVNNLMIKHIYEFRPDLIGFNTISPLIYDTIECVNLILNSGYKGLLIAGGHHATAMPELTLSKIPGLNCVIEGEGEFALSSLTNGKNPASIPGLWYKSDKGITHSAPEQIEDLDTLPFPALDLLDMSFYLKPNVNTIRGQYLSTVSMITSRGCAHKCDFCSESLTFGLGIRFHSVGYVIEGMKKIFTDYSPEAIYFHDNDFIANESRFYDLCEKIIGNGLHKKLKWCMQTRADKINPEILKLAKAAGCVGVEIGIESSVQWQLDNVHKGSTVMINENAISLCRKNGMPVHAYMLMGFKGENISDLEKNLLWLRKLRPNTFAWNTLQLQPGTRLYNEKGDRFFEDNEWNEKNITTFYNSACLSNVSSNERTEWIKNNYLPFLKWHNRFNILKINPPNKIFLIILNKLFGLMAKRKYFK